MAMEIMALEAYARRAGQSPAMMAIVTWSLLQGPDRWSPATMAMEAYVGGLVRHTCKYIHQMVITNFLFCSPVMTARVTRASLQGLDWWPPATMAMETMLARLASHTRKFIHQNLITLFLICSMVVTPIVTGIPIQGPNRWPLTIMAMEIKE